MQVRKHKKTNKKVRIQMPSVVKKETKKTNICKQVSITIYYICLFAKKVYIFDFIWGLSILIILFYLTANYFLSILITIT